MPLTRSDIPDLLLPGLRAEFALAYTNEIPNGIVNQIATVVNTTRPSQRYSYLSAAPPMREFIDERRPQGLRQNPVVIEDKVFEATLSVERKAVEDDQLDMIRMRVRDLAQRVVQHQHELVVSTLVNGSSVVGHDGVPFFGSHNLGNRTFNNAGIDALDGVTLAATISSMMGVTDESGVPLGIMPDTLVVGPDLMWTALELVESPVSVVKDAAHTNTRNVFFGRMKVVVTPFLRGSSAQYWYLLDTKRAIRPVVFQQRKDVPVEFEALDNKSGSETAFMRDTYLYGVRGRYNAGYGLWQTAFGQFSNG